MQIGCTSKQTGEIKNEESEVYGKTNLPWNSVGYQIKEISHNP